jgi:metal-responsive CopG/Arc/MetJ family transcriptional regulator
MDKGSRRVKLTVSLSSDLVKRIEKRRKKGVSRSQVFEQMLSEGERAVRQRELEEEVRAYYSVPPTEEEKELSRFLSRASELAWTRNEAAGDDFSGWGAPKRKRK